MRTPLTKIYRAFAELDRFSEAQCRLLMRRVRLDPGPRALLKVYPVIASVVALVIVAILLAATSFLAWSEGLFRDADIAMALLAVLGIPAFSGLLIRDMLLRRFLIRAIRLRIDRVRCLGCKYILIGQRAIGDQVTCPECGRANQLGALGITAADLIPPDSEIELLSPETQADPAGE